MSTLFVCGNDEDGGFVHRYESKEELFDWLARVTGDPGTNSVDFDDIEHVDDPLYFDGGAYKLPMRTFKIIEGEDMDVQPKHVATDIELE